MLFVLGHFVPGEVWALRCGRATLNTVSGGGGITGCQPVYLSASEAGKVTGSPPSSGAVIRIGWAISEVQNDEVIALVDIRVLAVRD